MNRQCMIIGFLVATIAGCNARQDTPIEPQQAAKLGQQVKVYESSDLTKIKYKSLGPVEAEGCRWMLWDETPTEQGVTEQLLQKASAMNANGVTSLTRKRHGLCSGPGLLVQSRLYRRGNQRQIVALDPRGFTGQAATRRATSIKLSPC